MRDDDLYDDLLELNDDRAWKLAMGQAMREVVGQTRRTNGRVTALEAWRNRIIGVMSLVVLAVPVISAWMARVVFG